MVVVVVVLAVLVVGIGAWAVVLVAGRSKDRSRIAELTTELEHVQKDATEQRTRADNADAARLAAEGTSAAATKRATEAGQRAAEADKKAAQAVARATKAETKAADADRAAKIAKGVADDAQQEAKSEAEQRAAAEAAHQAAVAEAEAAQADAEAAAARAEAAEADAEAAAARAAAAETDRAQLADLLHPDGGWALDHLRLVRLWHDRLSLPGDETTPLAPLDDPTQVESEAVRLAVHVLTEASREETGVVIDLGWEVDQPIPPALASAIVRLAEELVAAARLADGGTLDVTIEDGAIVLRLATEPPIELPADLAAAVQRFEWPFTLDGDVIDARIPLAQPVVDLPVESPVVPVPVHAESA